MLRDIALRIEPYVFRALQPILGGRRPRSHRSLVAQKYLRGKGAEIGAFGSPCLVPFGASTTYIDRVPASYWSQFPEYAGAKIVEPDIIDDGISLSKVETDSLDFLVAAHMLEHSDDPITALKNWIRVVRSGGHLLVVVPDKRFTFDSKRPVTPLEHFFRDHEEGPGTSAAEHYRDIAINCMGLTDETEITSFISKSEPAVHFHTWTFETFLEFLIAANNYLGRPYEILEAQLNAVEDLAVLKVL